MDVKFTMPLDAEIAAKMTFIGKYYGRSRIKDRTAPLQAPVFCGRLSFGSPPITTNSVVIGKYTTILVVCQ